MEKTDLAKELPETWNALLQIEERRLREDAELERRRRFWRRVRTFIGAVAYGFVIARVLELLVRTENLVEVFKMMDSMALGAAVFTVLFATLASILLWRLIGRCESGE